MVLDRCTREYELVNIQAVPDYSDKGSAKTFGCVDDLVSAIDLCYELNVDIVSMSAVTSLLSDSRILYEKMKKLSEWSVIVAALVNAGYVTVPASYPFVIGVQNDSENSLSTGKMAYRHDAVFGTDVFANCAFPFLYEQGAGPSNSFAVPVVTAYINDMLNSGQARPSSVFECLKGLPEYTKNQEAFARIVEIKEIIDRVSPRPPVPYVYIQTDNNELCLKLMDWLFDNEEVQSCALVREMDKYDIRLCRRDTQISLQKQLQYMQWFYKTDIVFVCGNNSFCEAVENVEYSVKLICGSQTVDMVTEDKNIAVTYDDLPNELYMTLYVDEEVDDFEN